MKNNRVELMAEKMQSVNGGDYGDTKRDQGNEPLYSVGQEIELYNTAFHVTTTRHKIYAAKKIDGSHWAYRITDDPSGNNVQWIYANDIESAIPEGSW